MIEATQLKKSFGKVIAVKDVSLTAANGQITGLLGENGAGKTTTIRMLSGILSPENGHIKLDGQTLFPNSHTLRKKLGVLSDQRTLYPKLTTRENISYFAGLMGMSQKETEVSIDKLISMLDLEQIIDRRTEGFSTGQKMKCALARILVYQPTTILLDEPTAGLDVLTKRNLRNIMKRLRDDGMCLLLSTHIMEEVEWLCDQVFIMHQGKTLQSGTVDQLLSGTQTEKFEDAFVQLIQ